MQDHNSSNRIVSRKPADDESVSLRGSVMINAELSRFSSGTDSMNSGVSENSRGSAYRIERRGLSKENENTAESGDTQRSVTLPSTMATTRHLAYTEKLIIEADRNSSDSFSNQPLMMRVAPSGVITIGPPWLLKICDDLESTP